MEKPIHQRARERAKLRYGGPTGTIGKDVRKMRSISGRRSSIRHRIGGGQYKKQPTSQKKNKEKTRGNRERGKTRGLRVEKLGGLTGIKGSP